MFLKGWGEGGGVGRGWRLGPPHYFLYPVILLSCKGTWHWSPDILNDSSHLPRLSPAQYSLASVESRLKTPLISFLSGCLYMGWCEVITKRFGTNKQQPKHSPVPSKITERGSSVTGTDIFPHCHFLFASVIVISKFLWSRVQTFCYELGNTDI